MDTFIWTSNFETGIPLVDSQHRKLVDITNQLGQLLQSGDLIDESHLQEIFHELAEYGRHHFRDEEQLMLEKGIDLRHRAEHAGLHRQFFEQVVGLWKSRTEMARPAEIIHGFLASWLTVHILGEDRNMARQFARIEQGESAEAAYAAEQQGTDPSTSILLDAFQRLYTLLAEQNLNLERANASLEARVAERTHDLAQANERMEADQKELTTLLSRVEEAQQQLLQSEKMAAIGQLAAGVAHEINNPVGFVNSNLGTLKTYIGNLFSVIDAYEAVAKGGDPALLEQVRRSADLDFLREDLPSLVSESQEGLSRVTKIVQDLKDFSHVDQSERQMADLNAAMESTLNVVWNELKYKAEVVRELADIPKVECSPAQINQVFMNLLVNAAQAIDDFGRITVRSGQENGHVWFEVADTGKGMPAEVRSRIFEPFFTTKPVGKGTGLGLSISYDIVVKKHHGRFDVSSKPGAGTTFRLWLPISSS